MIRAEQFDFLTDSQGALEVRYPAIPGSKRSGTSAEAAPSTSRAQTLRELVLSALQTSGPMTADEVAEKLQESVLAIRPRCSELLALGKIKETSARRRNASGKSAVVWKWVNPSVPF